MQSDAFAKTDDNVTSGIIPRPSRPGRICGALAAQLRQTRTRGALLLATPLPHFLAA